MAFRQSPRIWPLFVGHLLAYASALVITILVFNADLELGQPQLWVALWAASTICSLLLLIAALVPRAAIQPLRTPVLHALASGLVVGVLALLAGSATSVFWRPMSQLTLEVVTFLLNLSGREVVSKYSPRTV